MSPGAGHSCGIRVSVCQGSSPWRAAGLLIVALGVASPACTRAQESAIISARGIAGVAICALLERVSSAFPEARDTTVIGEDGELTWPAKRVPLGKDEWLLAEGSWEDHTRVARITTNSPRYRTGRGYRVGMRVRDLVDRGEPMEMGFEEGVLVVSLLADSVAFLIDDAAAERFFQEHPNYTEASLRDLPPDARIARFVVHGRACPAR